MGKPGVMSMSVSPTFSASNTRESGISCCTRALVVDLPAPWVPLSHTIMGSDATSVRSEHTFMPLMARVIVPHVVRSVVADDSTFEMLLKAIRSGRLRR